MSDLVTPKIALAVLWYFGQPQGLEPGHFTQALLEAIGRADLDNRERLRLGFPGHVEAYVAGAEQTDGVAALIAIAGAG